MIENIDNPVLQGPRVCINHSSKGDNTSYKPEKKKQGRGLFVKPFHLKISLEEKIKSNVERKPVLILFSVPIIQCYERSFGQGPL